MDERVGEYINKQRSPQKEILQQVREIFHRTLPGCEEKAAWGAVTFAGGKFYVGATKNCVHVGFTITGLKDDELTSFEGTGKTMRHVKIHSFGEIDEEKLVRLIQLVDKKTSCDIV